MISPQLLRTRNLGQIDLARVCRKPAGWQVEIVEVKSSVTGEEGILRGQRKRLLESGHFIAALLGMKIKFTTVVG